MRLFLVVCSACGFYLCVMFVCVVCCAVLSFGFYVVCILCCVTCFTLSAYGSVCDLYCMLVSVPCALSCVLSVLRLLCM